jgi:anti-sigma factor RsiW
VIARDVGPSDDLLMLQALLDGELDASGIIDMERRIAADPRLSAEYARLRALRGAIQGGAMREAAPDSLRARIAAATGVAAPGNTNVVKFPELAARPSAAPVRRWRAIAGAMAAAVVALLGANIYLLSDWGSDDVARAAVAAHTRGLISGQPVDVVSTDRHTVKPWLAGKVPLATTVVDLASDGYALKGGRVDVIGDVPVPTLVYQHREHFISLSELARGSARESAPTRETVNGHSVVTWTDNVRRYVAVSDMSPPELDDFVATFRRAAANEREDAPPKAAPTK